MTTYEIVTAYWPILSGICLVVFLLIVWALDQKSRIKSLEKLTTVHASDIEKIKDKSELFEGKIFSEITGMKVMMAEINGYFKAMFKDQK